MSRLILVRHAQASFFDDNYDQLSPAGQLQAQRLGAFWVERQVRFDYVYTGPRQRHRHTAELVGECYANAGLSWPQPIELKSLDEHRVDQHLLEYAGQLAGDHPQVARLANAMRAAVAPDEKQAGFQRLFEAVTSLWVQGACGTDGEDSWSTYREQIRGAVREMTSHQGRGLCVAAFTSVGAITVALQAALDCPDDGALELGWRVRNASLSELLFSKDRMTLDHFNNLAHLSDPAEWTYR